jgi:peptide-methionine (R)-S-oxide reductase
MVKYVFATKNRCEAKHILEVIMNYKIFITLAIIFVFALVTGCISSASSKTVNTSEVPQSATPVAAASSKAGMTAASNDEVFDGNEIVKTNEEWKKLLSPVQYHILREAGTEEPYTGEYAETHENGDYYCAACHLKLFSSKNKFESGTGWPSFYQPINKKNVIEITDKTLGMVRTEVLCARCRGHLGHVFDDGPVPTGLRYCMNSGALKFEKAK